MAERVTTTKICDYHLLDDEEVLAEEGTDLPPITIAGEKPRQLQLCKECRVDYFEPFVALVAKGKPVTRAQAKNATMPKAKPRTKRTHLPSFICEGGPASCSRTFKNEAGLKIHQGRHPGHKPPEDAGE